MIYSFILKSGQLLRLEKIDRRTLLLLLLQKEIRKPTIVLETTIIIKNKVETTTSRRWSHVGGVCDAQSGTNYLKDQLVAFFQPSDNKLAMKLFGNKNALNKEKIRQRESGNWVIHPCSNFR
jgi:hypothetical protein